MNNYYYVFITAILASMWFQTHLQTYVQADNIPTYTQYIQVRTWWTYNIQTIAGSSIFTYSHIGVVYAYVIKQDWLLYLGRRRDPMGRSHPKPSLASDLVATPGHTGPLHTANESCRLHMHTGECRLSCDRAYNVLSSILSYSWLLCE